MPARAHLSCDAAPRRAGSRGAAHLEEACRGRRLEDLHGAGPGASLCTPPRAPVSPAGATAALPEGNAPSSAGSQATSAGKRSGNGRTMRPSGAGFLPSCTPASAPSAAASSAAFIPGHARESSRATATCTMVKVCTPRGVHACQVRVEPAPTRAQLTPGARTAPLGNAALLSLGSAARAAFASSPAKVRAAPCAQVRRAQSTHHAEGFGDVLEGARPRRTARRPPMGCMAPGTL